MVGLTRASALTEAPPRRSPLAAAIQVWRASPVAAGSGLLLLLIILMAIFAPVIAPYDPLAGDYTAIRQGPTWAHPMGTDDIGRDVLSRIIYGARTSLIVG